MVAATLARAVGMADDSQGLAAHLLRWAVRELGRLGRELGEEWALCSCR